MTETLDNANDSASKNFIAASLGDARAAIDLFSRPEYKDIPDYRNRLREAKRKLKLEKKDQS